MTREDVILVVGPMDDSLIFEIIETGATKEELEEAIAWLYADDAMTRALHHQPHGTVAELCEILSRSEIEIDRRD
ncbi:MAG TPA: hypothetical protein VJ045_10650 [Hyphomicrobiaceae bacterium]|nr:hypothetical protein [Hyphomicrobiaceae bacterium]